jgi:hypothetical protein
MTVFRGNARREFLPAGRTRQELDDRLTVDTQHHQLQLNELARISRKFNSSVVCSGIKATR